MISPSSFGSTSPEMGTAARSASNVPNKSCTRSSIPLKAERIVIIDIVTAAITNIEMPEIT